MRRLLLLLCLLFLAAPARADPFLDAVHAEEELAFAHALSRYEQSIREAPTSNTAARAMQRAAALRARSEGDFVPLATLEHARRQPSADLHGLMVEAEGFPPGLVRVEAWVFIADGYARAGHPEDAIPLWRRAARDPQAEPVLARAAIRSAVQAHLAHGEIEQAEVDLGWYFDEGVAIQVRRAARRGTMHRASIGLIAFALVGALVSIVRSKRRGIVLGRMRAGAKVVVAYALYVAAAGGLLAAGYAGGSAAPFVWLGVVLVPLLFTARAWAAAGSAPRALRAAACAASVLGAAFLVLEHTGHLDSMGL